MGLKQLTWEQVKETPGFYMAVCAMEYLCETANDNWPDSDDQWKPERFEYLLTPDGDLIASRIVGFGPREPDYVWDGPLHMGEDGDIHEASWICSEDNLSADQRALMDRVAKHCPGGLGGWS